VRAARRVRRAGRAYLLETHQEKSRQGAPAPPDLLWIAAQDSPDGEQLEDADLDALLTLLRTKECGT
jgi:hypothetical protein